MILGISGVGKSSFGYKIVEEIFYKHTEYTTFRQFGMSVEIKEIKNSYTNIPEEINLIFYEVGGIERYRSIQRERCKEMDGLIIIYRSNIEDSFDSINEYIESIKSIGNEKPIILIGNKFSGDESKKEKAVELCNERKIIWGGEYNFKEITQEALIGKIKPFILEIYRKYERNYFRKINKKNLIK